MNEKLNTTANKLTLSRMFFGGLPPAIVIYCCPHNFWVMLGCLIWVLSYEGTDVADGIIARLANEVSAIGKLLDPLADVLMHVPLFIALFYHDHFSPVAMFVVVMRELLVTGTRLVLAVINNGDVQGAKMIGKAKTWLYGICVCYEIIRLGLEAPNSPYRFTLPDEISQCLFGIVILASIISGAVYGWNFYKKIRPLL